MKVVFVSHMFPHAERPMFGTFVRDYAEAIKGLGVDLDVIHLQTKLPWPLNRSARYRAGQVANPTAKEYADFTVPFPTLPGLLAFRLYSLRAAQQVAHVIEQINSRTKVDLIHAHNLFPDAALCVEAKKRVKARLVVTSHGTDNRVHVHRRARRRVIDAALPHVDHVIGVSRKVIDELEDAGVPTKSSVIYNGFSAGAAVAADKRPGRTILAVCHLDLVEKGVDILIAAFGRVAAQPDFKDCRLVIVGGGKNADRLKQLAHGTAGAAITFTGPLQPSDVRTRFASCDIFCLPSWYEAFGVVYLEAMSFGKPVIAVRGQGIAEILRDRETGVLIEPRDVESCAAALEFLLRDAQARERIGAAGQRLSMEFTWRSAAEKTAQIYNTLLAGQADLLPCAP